MMDQPSLWWTRVTAPQVQWYMPEDPTAWVSWSHAHSTLTGCDARSDCASGSTFWEGRVDGRPVFLGWDWIEVRPGVAAMQDPNGVVSNIVLLNDATGREACLLWTIAATRMIHGLDWQPPVQAQIERETRRVRPLRREPAPAATGRRVHGVQRDRQAA